MNSSSASLGLAAHLALLSSISIPQDGDFSILKHHTADRQSDRPGQQNKARNSAYRTNSSPQLGADADSNSHDVRSRHELAKGQGLGKFLLVHPSALLDDNAARPNEPAAEAASRDFEKADE